VLKQDSRCAAVATPSFSRSVVVSLWSNMFSDTSAWGLLCADGVADGTVTRDRFYLSALVGISHATVSEVFVRTC
jgi:hypothetical protein